ncbi:GLUG motif-containing protein [Pseudomonas chlororaphis]|uniref:GLUG motif-containing protein n=1 Tax=Pseudomonas chlororaphis TaxID=587753 RepID=UPI0007B3B509|nr:GLUG motif-containing protein [Pseudomonas chlororaphis]AZC62281.1 filamentous hemagglutinin [Pseudomonas chlororaphis subsp. piscium]AZC68519.1 filamentous hemagglutinin [Pseudomonas chlororaphis subsp. piscium]AZC80925.1 filamentous hemagglutinin [Pseudomonas chlororaphis subsp. piscium]AZC88099.1 filamentous hemagglutinin [Pseudomonas chlororaphis subsp. piscium]AZC94545.1 filamentous hemagglutinin [Pseudomonas chlororaphis subsp. piscium]
MNKSYALIWNQATGCWNVASEGTRRRGKSSRLKVVIAAGVSLLGLLAQAPAFALPGGAAIVAGEAGIHTSNDGKHMTVEQQSNKVITNWNDFSVAGDESVSFHQPGSHSIALNRVVGTQGSDIQGCINANGKVFLINPNGVVFGKSAQVNVGGLVASTQNISDKDFLDGSYRFTGNSSAAVSNAGQITASEGGSVALLGAQVSNSGVIQAQMGSVALGAGKDFSVNFDGNGLLNLQVKGAAVDALVQNGGLLKADGGQVLMTASSASSLLKNVVSNQGVIEAKTLQNKAGKIVLDGGDNGIVQVAGRQDASALGGQGNGGVVENRGARVEVQLASQVDTRADKGTTGTWKIRSNEVSVSKAENPSMRGLVIDGGINGNNGTGGNIGTTPTLHADTLAQNLARTNVELSSKGNLSVNKAVSWSSGNKLGLTAERGDVQVNAALSATGAGAALALNAAQGGIRLNDNVALSGSGASLELNSKNGHSLKDDKSVTLSGADAHFSANGEAYQVVQNLKQLRDIENNMNGRYVLGNQITGQGSFRTIGEYSSFAGKLDGLGNTISDLSIYGTTAFVGLFSANLGQISNLNLERISANGASSSYSIGTLAGLNMGSIRNVKAKDIRVTAGAYFNSLGGLVGLNLNGEIANASVSGQVIGNRYTMAMGGLVGESVSNPDGTARITNSHADITLAGQANDDFRSAGGLVGSNRGGVIANSSSTGTINLAGANLNIGGLVGENTGNGSISNSRSSTNVLGGQAHRIGGLVGFNQGSLVNAHASGEITGKGTEAIGGLVGKNQGGSIANSSASGNVSDLYSKSVGGLIGHNQGGRIDNASVSGTVKGGKNANIGGLIGTNQNSSISNSSAKGIVSGLYGSNVGGLIGYNQNSRIDNVTVAGTVKGGDKANIGGLIGYSEKSSIANASSTSQSVTGGDDARIGGLVGHSLNNNIANSSVSATVTGYYRSRIGGLVGYSKNTDITNASASAMVKGRDDSFVGGLVGHSQDSRLNNSSASATVSGDKNSQVGGLVGYSQGSDINNAVVSATVSGGTASLVGGLVGRQQGKVSNASVKGSVKGGVQSSVGGLAGQNEGEIRNSTTTSDVSGGYGARLGGLAGMNFAKMYQSSAGGKVDGSASVGQFYGGLVGIDFWSETQSLNSVFGEATKVPLVGLQL